MFSQAVTRLSGVPRWDLPSVGPVRCRRRHLGGHGLLPSAATSGVPSRGPPCPRYNVTGVTAVASALKSVVRHAALPGRL